MSIPTLQLFNINFSAVTQKQAVHSILNWTNDETDTGRIVVTPNVNLTLLQQNNPEFRDVLNTAALCLVDGRPIYWASRWLNKPLPEVVTGSDLVPALFNTCQAEQRPLRVFLLGAAPGVAERAAQAIETENTFVKVCGTYSPPFGFEHDEKECAHICERIEHAQTELLVIGLGAPKQELWAHRHLKHTKAKVAICAGATIDFLAGEKPRAPVWMRKTGLEWLFRLSTEPRRLAKRYWQDGLALPALIWQEYRKQKQQRS